MHRWTFTDAVPAQRQAELLEVRSFGEVIQRLVGSPVAFFLGEQRSKPVLCKRAFFRIMVSEQDFDAFFNSPRGYRAQYCASIDQGEACNRLLLDALVPACLSYIRGKEPEDFPADRITASLRGRDAKIWIEEGPALGVDEVHLKYPPWVAKAQAADQGTIADQAVRSGALAGVLAPVGSHLEVKGAWITASGEKWRDRAKAGRSLQIRDYGFS